MFAMYAITHSFPVAPKPAQVALGAPCPHFAWELGRPSNPTTLAEPRVR
jgi:hypothetical protein